MTYRQVKKYTNGKPFRKSSRVSNARKTPKRVAKTRAKSNKTAFRAMVKKVIREECNAVTLGNTTKEVVRCTPNAISVPVGSGTDLRYIYRIPVTEAIPTQKLQPDSRFRKANKINVVGVSVRVHVDYCSETRIMSFLHQPGLDNSEFNRVTMVSNVKGAPASLFNPGPRGYIAYTLEESGFLAKDGPFEMIKFGDSSDINCVDNMLYTARTSTDQGKPIGMITPKIDGYR
jgi:hypothetical protein